MHTPPRARRRLRPLAVVVVAALAVVAALCFVGLPRPRLPTSAGPSPGWRRQTSPVVAATATAAAGLRRQSLPVPAASSATLADRQQGVAAAAAPGADADDGEAPAASIRKGPALGSDAPLVDFEAIINLRLNISAAADQQNHLREIWATVDFVFKAPSLMDTEMNQRSAELRWGKPRNLIAICNRMGDPGSSSAFVRQLEQVSAMLDGLSNKLCWPLVRRSILAGIIKRRLQAGPFNARVTRAVTAVSLQLVRKHRDAAAYKGAAEFFHVSKAGGTSFCQLAQANGCSTQDFGEFRNCLVREFNDVPRWIDEPFHHQLSGRTNFTPPHFMRVPWFINYQQLRSHVSCYMRRKFMAAKGWTIYANEYTLHGGRTARSTAHVCSNILTVLLFRHPVPRLHSHIRWIYGLYHGIYGPTNASLFFPPGRSNVAHWQRLAPAVVNNYYTRSLLGEGTFHLPAEALTPAHAVRARLIVVQFDVLLTLEQTSLNNVLFRHALGWRHILSDVNRTRTSHGMVTGGSDPDDGMPYDMDKLPALNVLDLELYKFTLLLSMLDAIVFDVAAAADLEDASDEEEEDEEDPLQPPSGAAKRVRPGSSLSCGYLSLNSSSGSEFPQRMRPVNLSVPRRKKGRRRSGGRGGGGRNGTVPAPIATAPAGAAEQDARHEV